MLQLRNLLCTIKLISIFALVYISDFAVTLKKFADMSTIVTMLIVDPTYVMDHTIMCL